ncbi:MAG TPA: cytochrome c [Rummeliibacillus sp.]|nr:cytochrome c [Rummeliibacillus sp.]
MKKALLAMLLGSALVLGACGTTNKEKTTTNETTTTETKDNTANNTTTQEKTTETTKVDAEAVAKQKCISCHGNNLEGSVGPDLRKIGATLSEDQIKDVLKNGKGNMPAGLVSGAELDAVAKWLSEKK